MEAVFVTGASRLIGYQVARSLYEAGRDVLGFDIRPAPEGTPFPHVVGDLASLDAVLPAMAGRTEVVHAGAVSGPMLMRDDPSGVAEANLGGAAAVFEAARRLQVRRLVWLSSIAVYGDQPTLDPLTEDAPCSPRSFYGWTKVAGEALLRRYCAHYGLDAVALRLSSVYGIRRRTACALTELIRAGLSGRPVRVAAEGSSFRQYLHVEDATRAVLLALSAERVPGFAYNVTGESYVSEAALAHLVREFVPSLEIIPGPPAWNEGHLGPLVIEAAGRNLGFRPGIGLHEGVAGLYRDLAERDAWGWPA